jgi:hypothetical protein
MDLDSHYVSQSGSSLGWPRCSDAYDSGAAAIVYWLGSTLPAEWVP